ncbi:MAG: glycosyltransferase family 2 protein [Oscillospiraceae bacterium]|nr:glycosyltransferase family 2 protein [Oscillospiraceae bacterium]
MSGPRVSGCIVSYRCYDKCRTAVASIYANTKGVELTLYVVDNCSGDDTPARLRAEFPQLVVLENDANKGFGHGHNAVLPYLESDYHAVINPDIELGGDALTALCDYLAANPDVGIVTPQILFPDGRDQQLPKRNPPFLALFGRHLFQKQLKPIVEHYQMLDEDLTKPIDIEFATGCFFVIRTDIFKAIGGFDERFFMYFEDMDITRRAIGTGCRAVYYPYTYVYHAWERSSNKHPRFFVILIISMFKYYGKWGFQLK